jgi:hypothetical protein
MSPTFAIAGTTSSHSVQFVMRKVQIDNQTTHVRREALEPSPRPLHRHTREPLPLNGDLITVPA